MADPTKPDFGADEPPMVNPDASLAADDPTAVWDADSLREAGMDDVGHSGSLPPATHGPGETLPSMVAQDSAASPGRSGRPARKDMGWGATMMLALGLGAAVYLVVRFLR